jgi:hypothetical protein
MSPMSSSIDPVWARRILRVAGVLLLVALQGTALLVAWGLHQIGRDFARPSREARHAAVLAGAPVGPILPSVGGYVDHFGDDAIAVMTVEGPADVRVDRFTIYRTPDGPARPSDVHPASSLVVSGERDETGTVLADVVLIRPPQ